MPRLNEFRLSVLSLLVVLAGSMLAWMLLGRPLTGVDDADIFFVYARHLAEGHGFVYNVGGEQVEGFTSLLWTLICACMFRVTDHVELPLYLVNLLLGAATVYVCLQRARHRTVFLLLLAAAPSWFAWCQLTLMETGLWCRILTLCILAVIDRRRWLLALLLPLLVLTRPESMLWGGWLLLAYGLRDAGSGRWQKGLGRAAIPATAFALALMGLTLFRLIYFGHALPNTYYAKVSPNLFINLLFGAIYLLQYLLFNPAVLLVVFVWGGVVYRTLRGRWREPDEAGFLALCLIPGFAIPLLVGGDHFGGSRFFQPLWPLLCVLAANEWASLPVRFQWMRTKRFLGLLVLAGWLLFPFTAWLKHEYRIAQRGRETGAALATMFEDLDEYPSVATITAGGSKYTYPGEVYDLMGLNSTEMAHSPGARIGFKNHAAFNRDVFYRWQPDILLCGEDPSFDARVLKGLTDEERFRARYIRITLERNGRAVDAFYAHAFMERLQRSR